MARVTFVVGKGGVGKTTTAVALARELAAQQPTWLISTDPAHSLRDVIPTDIPQLQIEEFDARAYADAWLAQARAALLEVVERGTYLDQQDAASFLDLSLPGVDEVMAAFRLVELQRSEVARIVVDTAPTGHTLRLLEASDVIDSWADALDAMVAKADAVALGLVGQAPDWPAAQLTRDWRARAAAFRQLLKEAEFILVTRAEPVVQAETERLHAWLRERGYAVTEKLVTLTQPRPSPAQHSGEVVAWLHTLDHALSLCAGKGGVGKSTCAAALALLKSERTATCLVSTDPAGSLSDVIGESVSEQPRELAPGLRVWQLDAEAEYQRMRDRYADEVKRVFEQLGLTESVALDRHVIERLWNLAPPGIDEIVALTEILNAAERCPALVLDSAPTGHFLRLLEMPQIAVDWSHALIRLLLKYKVAGSLEHFSREVLDFAREARALREQLTDPLRTATFLVTLDHPVVWAETERLHASLRAAQIAVTAVVVNRADAGQRTSTQPAFLGQTRVILAPLMAAPPVGRDALNEFMRSWEFAT